MRVKIIFDIIERLKEHEEKIKNAFAAEDFIRAQMLICDKEKRDKVLLNELKSVSGFYHNDGKKPIDNDFIRGGCYEAT